MQASYVAPKPRVLIVEDEILIAEELKERLLRLGFSVIAAVDSAEEGISVAIRERPELVLMDIWLKGEKDGVQAVQEIQRHVDLSVVYLTAHSDTLTVDRAKATDYDGFVLKPFRASELQSTIEIALQRRALRANQNDTASG